MIFARKTTSKNDDALHSRLKTLKSDLGALQKDIHALSGEAGEQASIKINEALTTAMGTVQEMTDRFEDWTTDHLVSVRTTVRDQPLAACAFAAGAGALFGAILLRR